MIVPERPSATIGGDPLPNLSYTPGRSTWAAGLVLAAAMTLAVGTARAQEPQDDNDKPVPSAPGAVRASPFPAPVGHRQPRASDIPPPPAGDNAREVEPRDDINEKLRICRGC
jgi:hypothetical protein